LVAGWRRGFKCLPAPKHDRQCGRQGWKIVPGEHLMMFSGHPMEASATARQMSPIAVIAIRFVTLT